MDDRAHLPLIGLSFTEPAPEPLGELPLAPPGDELADELPFDDDYTLPVRSEGGADVDDYAPGYADDLDLDPERFIAPDADLEF